jgi:hypothetical protein
MNGEIIYRREFETHEYVKAHTLRSMEKKISGEAIRRREV